jgi:ATP-dependent helicase/nuclease subunit A
LPEEVAARKAEIAEKYETCRQASYKVEAVTKASEPPGGEVPFVSETGMGMSWGRIIHRMLEAAVREKDIDLELLAENFLREEERLLSEKDLVVGTVRAVMASELWKRMKKAEEVLVEVPFSMNVGGEVVPKIVAGVIDLAFRESDGWVIADYKTDKVDEKVDTLVAYYRPQIQMYSEFWEKMSGDRVKEAGLYFIDAGQWLTLQVLD